MPNDKAPCISEEQALAELNALSDELAGLNNESDDKINLFYAAGLTRQEVKHSAFLAWLLDPRKPHRLGNAFLERFIKMLYDHPLPRALRQHELTNSQILSKSGAFDDFADFINAKDITVTTESEVFDQTGRMDIVVESRAASTALIIENKTFTFTHDCQLENYERHYKNSHFAKKIFVYLTPDGFMPYDNGENGSVYRPAWCVCSYETIIKIVKTLIPASRTAENLKLKMIMEDYIEMINTSLLLKNKKVREKCKEIRRKYANALEILNNYTDNAKDIIEFCTQLLTEKLDGFYVSREPRETKVQGATVEMREYFERRGENIVSTEAQLLDIWISSQKGNVSIGCGFTKPSAGWSSAQKALAEKIDPYKKLGDKFLTVKSITLANESERCEDFDNISTNVENNCTRFIEWYTAKLLPALKQ